MPVPKRKHSKGRTKRKRNSHYKRDVVKTVQTKDKKGRKRPHYDEYIEV